MEPFPKKPTKSSKSSSAKSARFQTRVAPGEDNPSAAQPNPSIVAIFAVNSTTNGDSTTTFTISSHGVTHAPQARTPAPRARATQSNRVPATPSNRNATAPRPSAARSARTMQREEVAQPPPPTHVTARNPTTPSSRVARSVAHQVRKLLAPYVRNRIERQASNPLYINMEEFVVYVLPLIVVPVSCIDPEGAIHTELNKQVRSRDLSFVASGQFCMRPETLAKLEMRTENNNGKQEKK